MWTKCIIFDRRYGMRTECESMYHKKLVVQFGLSQRYFRYNKICTNTNRLTTDPSLMWVASLDRS